MMIMLREDHFTHCNELIRLKHPSQPDIDGRINDCRSSIESVSDCKEVIWADGEKLPIISTSGGDRLIELKKLSNWVPLVDYTVNIMVSLPCGQKKTIYIKA